MEINKISDEEIEIVSENRDSIFKVDVLSDIANLEALLQEKKDLLIEFDK